MIYFVVCVAVYLLLGLFLGWSFQADAHKKALRDAKTLLEEEHARELHSLTCALASYAAKRDAVDQVVTSPDILEAVKKIPKRKRTKKVGRKR